MYVHACVDVTHGLLWLRSLCIVQEASCEEEDEVSVHAAWEMEEGEISSGEEGEIKGIFLSKHYPSLSPKVS